MIGTTWMAAVAAWACTYFVHSTLLLGGAWLLSRRLRERPDLMSGVWKIAMLGGIFTASAQLGLGVAPLAGQVALQPATVAVQVVDFAEPEPRVAELVPQMSAALGPEPSIVQAQGPALEPELAELGGSAPGPALAPELPREIVGSVPVAWAQVVGAILLFGGLLGALSVLVAFVSLRRRLRGRKAILEGSLVQMLGGLMRQAARRRPVRLSISARTSVPMATGIARPEIVLPSRATDGLAVAQQRTMLAHELAHVVRRDPAWRMLALLAERVLFFQPLNRLAADRMAECAEYVCDDWAARSTREPLALAQCLTEVAGWMGGPRVVAASAMAASSSQLRDRVLRLLQPARPAPPRRWTVALAMIGVAAVAWIAPGVSSGAPAPAVIRIRAPEAIVMRTDDGDHRGTIVVAEDGGVATLTVVSTDAEPDAQAAALAEAPATSKKAARKSKRRAAKANRKADRALGEAMRKARREGKAAPSRAEVDRIFADARREAGQAERAPILELHLVLPGGVPHKHAKQALKVRRHHAHGADKVRHKLKQQLKHKNVPPEVREQVERMLQDLEVTLEQLDGQPPAYGSFQPPRAPTPPSPPAFRGARPRAPAPPTPPASVRRRGPPRRPTPPAPPPPPSPEAGIWML